MAKLSYNEKRRLEDFLKMGDGYVLDFSNRTFKEFVFDSTGLDIDAEGVGGLGSKAKRLRHFWTNQPDHIVGKLISDLVEYPDPGQETSLRAECRKIAARLLQAAPVPDTEVISVLAKREEFEQLANEVLRCIERNDPESGLDRLHTFTTRFVRSLCEKRGIPVDKEKALHSIYGEYVKKLKSSGLIESRMTETILKTSISVLEAFNDVRNNRSLAHDNTVLNRNESLLIFSHVTAAIRFLWALENSQPDSNTTEIKPRTGRH